MIADEVLSEKVYSFNRSFICGEIIKQIHAGKKYQSLPSLTLNVGDDGVTPDLSIYLREQVKPNYWRDIERYSEMPVVAIQIVSPGQNIQILLETAEMLIENGVNAVWTIEPVTNVIIVANANGEFRFQNVEVESEDIKIDFRKIFGNG